MHEMSATQQILSLALAAARDANASTITRVNVRVGEWSTFEPTCLEFYFGILAKDTAAEGAELALRTVPVTYACSECGEQYQPAGIKVSCPRCSSHRTEFVAGRELCVDSVEIR